MIFNPSAFFSLTPAMKTALCFIPLGARKFRAKVNVQLK